MNSSHFLGYSGYAEETTLGMKDLREQLPSCQSSMASILASIVAPLRREQNWRRASRTLLASPCSNQWPTEEMYQASTKHAQS
jgi:hypothetical protein